MYLRDEVVQRDFNIAQLLVEMAAEQQYGVLEFALAIAERAFAELTDDQPRADRDRRDQENAGEDEPKRWAAPKRRWDVIRRGRRGPG